jgi:hypothetical protein
MISIFRGVCGYVCVVRRIMLWCMCLAEEPVVYVGCGWGECANFLWCDVIEACVFTKLAKVWVILSSIIFVCCGLEVSSH